MSAPLESRIAEWRSYVERGRAVEATDVDELESHLRDRVDELRAAGLDDDEAFLVAAKRMGAVDPISSEFARVHSTRLWKQLVLGGTSPRERGGRDLLATVLFALAAALVAQAAWRLAIETDGTWLLRNLAFVVLPLLAGSLLLRRGAGLRQWIPVAATFAVAAAIVNLFPYASAASGMTAFAAPMSASELIVAIHLPVALWFAVGAAYTGAGWRDPERRMDFVRFTGEFAIYLVLIVLGGGVLYALTSLVIMPLAPQAVGELSTWMLPSGGAAAFVVAAWLVQAKQSVVENLAPVLTAIFTPLFALMLVAASVAYVLTGAAADFDRELLAGFDVLLIVVLALVLFGISARDASRPAGLMDATRLVAILGALALDALVLGSMLARIGEYGLTPNRVAALGLNVLLVIALAGAAWWSIRFLAGRSPVLRLERWFTGYLPVLGLWAVAMVVVLPPVFGFA